MGLAYWLQSKIATIIGDTWASARCLSIFPYPAVVIGMPKHLNTGADYRLFTSLLKPGDMLVTTTRIYYGSNNIPGSFKHLIVYTGPISGQLDRNHFICRPRKMDDSDMLDMPPQKGIFKRSIVHAISEGVKCQDLLDIWHHYDYIAAIRISDDANTRDKIVQKALSEVGKEYDFSPSPSDISRYCTELGAVCCEAAGVELPDKYPFMTSMYRPWHRDEIYIADKFIEKFGILAVTNSCNDPKLPDKSVDREMMRAKLLGARDISNAWTLK